MVKGEEGRGTLSILYDKARDDLFAMFTRDAGGGSDSVSFDVKEFDEKPTEEGPPQRTMINIVTKNGEKHSFVSFKEIPVDGAKSVRVTIVKAAMSPGVKTK